MAGCILPGCLTVGERIRANGPWGPLEGVRDGR